MLVCNVSLRAPRRSIAVELAEAAAALDATTTGNVVFATLVDDPASVNDIVDAFLGEVMVEAASASDAVEGGLAFTSDIAEAASAGDTQDGTVTAGSSYNSWNTSDKTSNITITGLVVTTTSTSTGGVRSTGSKTSGKIYFEVAWTGSPGGARYTCGINNNSVPLINLDVNGAIVRTDDGFIRINGAIQASVGTFASGDVAGIAFDLGVSPARAWFRRNNGTWNNSGTADPATNTGGYDISAMFPSNAAFASVSTSTSTSIAATANFGATAFAFTAPSGFTGWTVP